MRFTDIARNIGPPTAVISVMTSVVRYGWTAPASRVIPPCTISIGTAAKQTPGPSAAEKAMELMKSMMLFVKRML